MPISIPRYNPIGQVAIYSLSTERFAFSIVRVDVRYPDGIVGIVLQYGSSNKDILIYIYHRLKDIVGNAW